MDSFINIFESELRSGRFNHILNRFLGFGSEERRISTIKHIMELVLMNRDINEVIENIQTEGVDPHTEFLELIEMSMEYLVVLIEEHKEDEEHETHEDHELNCSCTLETSSEDYESDVDR